MGQVAVTLKTTSFPVFLAIASVSELTQIVSNNDDPNRSNASDTYSRVLLNAVAGTTYQIAVDGFNGATGSVASSALPLEPSRTPLLKGSNSLGERSCTAAQSASGAAF